MTGKCQHCGKTDFDLAYGAGPDCRRPHIEDAAVGGWACGYIPPREGQALVAVPVAMFGCPVCRCTHAPSHFKDGSLFCRGCGNTITLEEST